MTTKNEANINTIIQHYNKYSISKKWWPQMIVVFVSLDEFRTIALIFDHYL